MMLMIRSIGISALVTGISNARPELLLTGGLCIFTVVLIKGTRWMFLFPYTSKANALRTYLLGQAVNEVAPIGSGELTRVVFAKDRFGVSPGATLAACTVERLADTTFLVLGSMAFLMLAVSNLALPANFYTVAYMGIPIAMVIIGLGFLLLIRPTALNKVSGWLERLFSSNAGKLNDITNSVASMLGSFSGALEDFKGEKRTLLMVSILTIVGWGMEALGQYFIIRSFGFEVSILYLWGVLSISWIIGTFSFIPGGLGVREWVYTVVLGIPLAAGALAALMYRLMIYILFGGGALISLATLKKKKNKEKMARKSIKTERDGKAAKSNAISKK